MRRVRTRLDAPDVRADDFQSAVGLDLQIPPLLHLQNAATPPEFVAQSQKPSAILEWAPDYDSLDTIVHYAPAWKAQLADTLAKPSE